MPFRPELPSSSVLPTAGFPCLRVLSAVCSGPSKVPVNVFGTPSRYHTLVVRVQGFDSMPPASALASKVLGRSAFVNWPLMHEAKVVGISDAQ
ncbi:unnamed protein product, partial [Discosporangium mesarthrocarpum]